MVLSVCLLSAVLGEEQIADKKTEKRGIYGTTSYGYGDPYSSQLGNYPETRKENIYEKRLQPWYMPINCWVKNLWMQIYAWILY